MGIFEKMRAEGMEKHETEGQSRRNTTVKYGDTMVLDNLNWAMKQGENWAIVGPNGSGKTTL